jgi:hypothetical protein
MVTSFLIKGLYPGRAFVVFSEYSHWVFLNTNTIPFYKFFPKLDGRFTYNNFNFIQGDENPLSKDFFLKIKIIGFMNTLKKKALQL